MQTTFSPRSSPRVNSFRRALVVAVSTAATALPSLGVAVQIETKSIRILLDRGLPTQLENRLTGEILRLTRTHRSGLNLVRKNGAVRLETHPHAAPGNRSEPVSWRLSGPSGETGVVTYAADAATGDLRITQEVRSKKTGVEGVQWGLFGVPDDDVAVIVPGLSGVAFRRGRAPFSSLGLAWPGSWEAGMVLLQGQKGGFLIWAEDPELHYKKLRLKHRSGGFDLVFEYTNFAPFEKHSRARSFPWRITPYKGDWRAGAAIYRKWMARTLRPIPLEKRRPTWAGQIRFLAITGLDTEVIRRLARYVDPTATLLYVPAWRRDRYDMNYPDYTASDSFPPFLQEAHRLGFRVMVHVNYFGCDEKHPLYPKFEKDQLRDPRTGGKLWWIWPRNRQQGQPPTIKFAYIHPGSTTWRRLLISRFKGIVDKYGVDALHLDQTVAMPNHAGGRVDGLTVPEGNLLLHKELREALPDTALSGEGLNEVTLPYETFAQRHAGRAVDHVGGTWNDDFIACAHPISSFLFLPYTTIYGYLGMSGPGTPGLYRAWIRVYERWGVIPTFARPTVGQLTRPVADARILLEQAGLWTKYRMKPDFSGDWSAPVRFRYTGANGARAAVLGLPGEGSRCLFEKGGDQQEIYRYIRGGTQYVGTGSIEGWPAYTAGKTLGLPPNTTFLVEPRPPDLHLPHVSHLPETVTITRFRRAKGLFSVSLDDVRAERFFDLVDHLDEARVGEISAKGESELSSGGTFEAVDAVCAGGRKRAIFAHPPWKGVPGQTVKGNRRTFGEYTIALPKGRRAELRFSIALRDGVNGRSDGVTFQVLVDGQSVFRRHWAESRWRDCRVDLAAFAGRTVRVRLVTGPGPDRDISFDWALWGSPRISLQPDPTPRRVEYATPTPLEAILSSQGKVAPLKPARTDGGILSYAFDTPVPVTLIFLTRRPTPVQLPLELARTHFSVAAEVQGQAVPLPMRPVTFAPGTGTASGVQRPGLTAHPPNGGRVYADYYLRLPPTSGAPRFTFAVALQDGALSNGCRFLVFVNGRKRFDFLARGPGPWHVGRVDLSDMIGKALLLTLAVDSDGPYRFDWARWAEPAIRNANAAD
ncbi:MAG: hypothetical protein GXP31_11100 [Kiritimatiellaeota bacterium]|nr:hypothetical protein [Kiritimatiellota bacterium]